MAITKSSLDFGSADEILEKSYAYDAEIPLSVNGDVAYKVGDGESDPVIKLEFNSTLQRWQVIGVKITKYTTENEPFSVYFLASNGKVRDTLESMNLESIIVELIDGIFLEEKPNMVATIKSLFTETIEPLVNEKLGNIPDTIENLMANEIDNVIDERLELVLDEKFSYEITNKITETIHKFHLGRIEPYNKETQTPAWVGTIFYEAPSTGDKSADFFTRRINTNGIEEQWMSSSEKRINAYTNDDELTQMFNNIEPYKSMGRMEILLSDLKNIEGDSIYSKSMFERLMSQSLNRNNATWNGQFYCGNPTDIYNRQSAWFVPIKKCHFIEVEFRFNGLSNKECFTLRAVGEKEFKVDLKKYFPNANGFKFKYYRNDACGYKEHLTEEDGVITSRLHPAFMTKYDNSLNLMSDFAELDYIYIGAFLNSLFRTTDETKGINVYGHRLLPKPFANIYTKGLQFKQTYDQYLYHVYGNNPTIGVNLRPLNIEYTHLVYLLHKIESAYEVFNYVDPDYGFKWCSKTLLAGKDTIFKSGLTWRLGNESGKVYHIGENITHTNFRGIEDFNYSRLYQYIYGIHKSGARVWHAYPHTSRKMPAMYGKDADWKDTGYDCKPIDLTSRNLRGILGIFQEPISGLIYENNYIGNNNDSRNQLYYGSFHVNYNTANSLWTLVSDVYWPNCSRANI